MSVISSSSHTGSDGIEHEIIVHDVVTVETVYDHILSYKVFELVTGEERLNIAGVESWFLEELRWPHM